MACIPGELAITIIVSIEKYPLLPGVDRWCRMSFELYGNPILDEPS